METVDEKEVFDRRPTKIRLTIPKFTRNQKDYKVGFCAGSQECARRERQRKRATKD